jgi:hypothetical protein
VFAYSAILFYGTFFKAFIKFSAHLPKKILLNLLKFSLILLLIGDGIRSSVDTISSCNHHQNYECKFFFHRKTLVAREKNLIYIFPSFFHLGNDLMPAIYATKANKMSTLNQHILWEDNDVIKFVYQEIFNLSRFHCCFGNDNDYQESSSTHVRFITKGESSNYGLENFHVCWH